MNTINFHDYGIDIPSWEEFISKVKRGIKLPACVAMIQNFGDGETNDLLIKLATSLGRPHAQPALPEHPHENGLVFRVEVRGDGIRDARNVILYSTTDWSFSSHTDGSGKRRPYDAVLLHCVKEDRAGGESIVIRLSEVLACLDSTTIQLLKDSVYPVPYGCTSILSGEGEDICIRYNRDELTYYNTKSGISFTKAHQRALNILAETLNWLESRCLRFHLQEGNCLIIDNRRALHGRSQLSKGTRRLVKRIHLYWQ